ncbi:amidase [Gordonia sp. TBRC 11910]|uniref:Amidase n=1 Tax=Gordonia asplenii TaxID=2725283 RepID=A0A848KLL3_9ACTN|nr:amidase [Gordonia asplenii]NMN99983.1 amidase [Gordonia asplenii]
MDTAFSSAADQLAAMRRGEITSIELTDAAIARIEALDGKINAVCVPDFERARAAARRSDAARAAGDDRPLLGLPVTVKESFNIAGLPTTWGIPASRDFIADADAVQVTRLTDAGAVILGKTNVPLFLGDLQSYNDIYGTTNNPWDLTRTPGGSSGGSAAALAAGYGALSIGSDIGGSLRTPAHFSGVYAHKPTFDLLASRGHTPPGAPALPSSVDMAVVGPMARTAPDLTLLFDVMAGPDPLTEGIAYRTQVPAPRHDRIADFRALVLTDHPLVPTGSAVRAAVEWIASTMESQGAQVIRSCEALPDLGVVAALYSEMLMAELAAAFPPEVYRTLAAQADGLAPDDTSLDAARLRGAASTHRAWIESARRREVIRHRWRQVFDEVDVVIAPITPTPAFPHDHTPNPHARRLDVDGVEISFNDQLLWAGVATLPGLPATAIPTGLSEQGLPVGVQLIGPMFEDRTPLRLAELLADEIGGFVAPEL